MTTGEKIKKRRLELGITQKELADKINVRYQTLQFWETGKRKPKIDNIKKIADALEMDFTELCGVSNRMVEPTSDDFGAICNCAVRYCLGRRSYMPSLVCGYITPLLPELTDKTLDCFERDIAERKRTGFDFGDSCGYETWDAFYKAVCKEIERRNGDGSQAD